MAEIRAVPKIGVTQIPTANGYIVVDPKKCCGCQSCMIACSLIHEGRVNISLSRIQVIQDPYGHYPDDLSVHLCRQCVDPECLVACPVEGALVADGENGNVRRIVKSECIGCQECIQACPYTPSRIIWNHEESVAQKCDLCTDAPYWDKTGGPGGQQGCVEACPMQAIVFTFTGRVPPQPGTAGYSVHLRGEGWPLDKS